jgi:hypothetical protein
VFAELALQQPGDVGPVVRAEPALLDEDVGERPALVGGPTSEPADRVEVGPLRLDRPDGVRDQSGAGIPHPLVARACADGSPRHEYPGLLRQEDREVEGGEQFGFGRPDELERRVEGRDRPAPSG